MTITEALAEIHTLRKRMSKKRRFVSDHVVRPSFIVDPLDDSTAKVTSEVQAFKDLAERLVALRTAVNIANAATSLTVNGTTRTIAQWIVWRREVSSDIESLYVELRNKITATQQEYANKVEKSTGERIEIIAHYDEEQLATDIESHETVLGALDGKLSMLNATTEVVV